METQVETKKHIIVKTVLMISTFIIFALIFIFSNQNAEKSMSLSRKVTEKVTQNIEWIQKLENTQRENVLLKTEAIIRKLAHFSIYLLLGTMVMNLMLVYQIKLKYKILCSFSFGFFYAVIDEIHQLFISGRSGRAIDVFIDSCGVLTGIGIVLLMRIIVKKIISKNSKQK